jgi:hypothetical protein
MVQKRAAETYKRNRDAMHRQMRKRSGGFNTLPCIICRKKLVHVEGREGLGNHPDDGVACFSRGNYGSTVFDPMDGHFLEFNICDGCLVKAREQGLIALGIGPAALRIWTEGLEDSPFDEAMGRAIRDAQPR